MKRAILAVCVSIACPAAACPTAADAARGLVFTTDVGAVLLHKRAANGSVSIVELRPDRGEERLSTLLYGIWPLSNESGAEIVSYSYPDGVGTLEYPALGMGASRLVEFGVPGVTQRASFRFEVAESPVTSRLGACDYETYGVATELALPRGQAFSAFIHWYPALGTGVPVKWTDAGEGEMRQTIVGVETR